MKLQGAMSKLMNHVFAQIDGVVWDMMSNQTGVKRDDGIYTLSKDGQVELNPFDSFAMELPAFSQLVPIDQVKRGDVLVSNGKPTGWVLEAAVPKEGDIGGETKTQSSIQALSFQGHQTRFRPKKVSMMGIEHGITVVRSPFNFDGTKGSGFGDMSSMLPMLMLASGKDGAGGMDMKTLALMSMMGGSGGGGMGGMNPMMLMMLMGGDDKPGFSNR